MRNVVARRLIQFGLLMLAEGLFFSLVPMNAFAQFLISAGCALPLVLHWRRVANPKPQRRKRVGPPLEWID